MDAFRDSSNGEGVMTDVVPEAAHQLAGRLAEVFEQDQALAERQNESHSRLRAANDRLWWGLHPDGQAAIYGEHPAAVDQAFANNRSEVLGASDPLVAVQRVHWQIHRAFCDYQQVSEDRRHLAAEIGELIAAGDQLVAAGWSEDAARTADVHQLATAAGAR